MKKAACTRCGGAELWIGTADVQAAFPRRNGYTCRASANPNNVNAMPPAMCNSNTAAASAYRAASSFSATSAEKAENVVKLPKNPVTKSSLHIWFGDKPSTTPAKKQPSQLAASVPTDATCP